METDNFNNTEKTAEEWKLITTHHLIERYGMTECGMVLSNDINQPIQNSVGTPMPGVEVKIRDEKIQGFHLFSYNKASNMFVIKENYSLRAPAFLKNT